MLGDRCHRKQSVYDVRRLELELLLSYKKCRLNCNDKNNNGNSDDNNNENSYYCPRACWNCFTYISFRTFINH